MELPVAPFTFSSGLSIEFSPRDYFCEFVVKLLFCGCDWWLGLPTRLLMALRRITGDRGFFSWLACCSSYWVTLWMLPCLDILSFFCGGILGFDLMISMSSKLTSAFGRASLCDISSLEMCNTSAFSVKARPPLALSKFSMKVLPPLHAVCVAGCPLP